ncbi:MAG: imidazole glycerol phosphate synthase cyclase subunit [Candidatus Omnitrophota bacterium]|jgi:cyclase
MPNIRLIARLDIKGHNLIKSIHLEGLRVIGDPQLYARKYYEQGIDELIYMDIVASLYDRNNLLEIVRRTSENIFVPMTAGGGIRSIEDAKNLLNAGADKVAINTAVVKNPDLVTAIARTFGSQCMVLSIEAKKKSEGIWEAYCDNGREKTGLNVVDWAKQGVKLGAGEILLTSIDYEGTASGFDYELAREVCDAVSIPVIVSGGMGSTQHFIKVVKDGHADAVAMAHVLHYDKLEISEIRQVVRKNGILIRDIADA